MIFQNYAKSGFGKKPNHVFRSRQNTPTEFVPHPRIDEIVVDWKGKMGLRAMGLKFHTSAEVIKKNLVHRGIDPQDRLIQSGGGARAQGIHSVEMPEALVGLIGILPDARQLPKFRQIELVEMYKSGASKRKMVAFFNEHMAFKPRDND